MSTWLWPDHMIGTRESRALREEHNALVNQSAELLAALRTLCDELHKDRKFDVRKDFRLLVADAAARAAIAKAGG